jgi:hypothetical protein
LTFPLDKKSFWGDGQNRAFCASMYVYGGKGAMFFSHGVATGKWQLATGDGENLTAKTQRRLSGGFGLMCGLDFGR